MNRFLLFLFCTICLLVEARAQFNVKIGYEMGYISSLQNQAAVSGFNDFYSAELSQGKIMPVLNYTHGLTMGLAYKWEYGRLSANWHSSSRRRSAYGETVFTMESFEREVRYSMRGINLQYEFVYDRFSIGFAPGRDVFRMTSLIGNSDNDKRILNEDVYNIRFNIGIQLIQSTRVSVYLEPYYTLLVNDVDHRDEFIFLDAPLPTENTVDRPHFYGFQLLFYNGIQ